jgi:dTMP kinase
MRGPGGEDLPPDRIETEKISFHEKVRKGYLTLARKEKKRFVVIDATQPPDIVSRKILSEVEKRLRKIR